MQVSEIAASAVEAYNAKQNMSLVLPRPWKHRPKGFPRGELLCEQQGSAVYSYDPMKVLEWLRKNEMIEMKLDENPGSDGSVISREA